MHICTNLNRLAICRGVGGEANGAAAVVEDTTPLAAVAISSSSNTSNSKQPPAPPQTQTGETLSESIEQLRSVQNGNSHATVTSGKAATTSLEIFHQRRFVGPTCWLYNVVPPCINSLKSLKRQRKHV